jgi:hypothetical protein
MAVRTDTFAFARRVPYFLERGVEQTIEAPVRHGTTGSLQTPDSGTITIVKPDGTDLVSAAAVTVASSTAQYTLTPSAAETLGAGYEVRWTLVFATVTYPVYRTAAYLGKYLPPNQISVVNLYGVWPWLQHRIPQSQGDTDRGGDGTGWQRQIDDAYYSFLRRVLEDGREPWKIREATGYYDWLLAKALSNAVGAIENLSGDEIVERRRQAFFLMKEAETRFRLNFDTTAPGRRSGGSALIRMAPVGRPVI